MAKAVLTFASLLVVAVLAPSCGSESPPVPHWRVVMEPEAGAAVEDLDTALDGVMDVAERRITELGGEVLSVARTEGAGIAVEFAGLVPDEVEGVLQQTGLLQLCEPVMNDDGDVAVARNGTVAYELGTCEPVRDELGEIIVLPGDSFGRIGLGKVEFVPWVLLHPLEDDTNSDIEDIVWQPATAVVDGEDVELNSQYVRPNASVSFTGQVLDQPVLLFEFAGHGAMALEHLTERLETRNYPLAPFLDGEPVLDTDRIIIAPRVVGTVPGGQAAFSGMSEEVANELSILINSGPYPLPMRIVEVEEILE